jgi:DNA polymerase theta
MLTEADAVKASIKDKANKDVLEKIKELGLSNKDPTKLEYWGLPEGICEQFLKHTKVKHLFDWQVQCLSVSEKVTKGTSNLVYFAPTSGGKSIVSEILMLRAILGFKKRAVYVLPYVSIVSEKAQYLQKLLENVNVKILQLHS